MKNIFLKKKKKINFEKKKNFFIFEEFGFLIIKLGNLILDQKNKFDMKNEEFLNFKNFYKNYPFLIFLVGFFINEKNQNLEISDFFEILPNFEILEKTIKKKIFKKKKI